MPEFRKNEVIGFIREGMRDLSISRPNKGWGIPFAHDPSKVIYVWVDALINYLTATGWPDATDYERLWPTDVNLMGKEIFVRFHATLWPAMLMALDLPLPKKVYAHGWWTIGGSKGGKTGPSLPHPTRLTAFLAERSGMGRRYRRRCPALCAVPRNELRGRDTEFSVENLLRRYNTDLANDLGNLLNRTLGMMAKYYDSVVPEGDFDERLSETAATTLQGYQDAIAEFRLNIALESAWTIVARANKYVDEQAPWTLAKSRDAGDAVASAELAKTMKSCLEAVRVAALLVSPFMPTAAKELYTQLGLADRFDDAKLTDAAWGGLPSGITVGPARPVFPRIQELAVDDETLRRLGSSFTEETQPNESEPKPMSDTAAEATPGAPVEVAPAVEETPMITIDDFMKVELKVGEILAAEAVPNADKLLRLTINLGEEEARTILAGIAEYYQPEDLVGKKVTVVANLLPRKMRGVMSQGMLLAADVDGKAQLVHPHPDTPVGSRVR